jgi:hypothetical protein
MRYEVTCDECECRGLPAASSAVQRSARIIIALPCHAEAEILRRDRVVAFVHLT